MKQQYFIMGGLIAAVVLSGNCLWSKDIVAASGDRAAIQTAVDQAVAGDAVKIPAGRWEITDPVELKEGIAIQGEGRDKTILVKKSLDDKPIFRLCAKTGKGFTVSDIAFVGIGQDALKNNPLSKVIDHGIDLMGGVRDFQIYNCRFTGFSGFGIYCHGAGGAPLLGHPVGVIWGNEFIDLFYLVNGDARGYGVGLYGDNSWPELALGTGDALFVEDNVFKHCRHCIAANYGGRYVFRNNNIVDNFYPYAAIDAHGKKVGLHGTRSYEIYHNRVEGGVEWPDKKPHGVWGFGIRGGDGVIFGNQFVGTSGIGYLMIEDLDKVKASGRYPVPDQTTDVWLWGNALNGKPENNVKLGWSDALAAELAPFLQEGRDFHYGEKPGYQPFVYPHPLRSLEKSVK